MAGQRASDGARRASGRRLAFRNGIVFTGIALIAALWAAVWWIVQSERATAISHARREAANLAFAVEEQVGSSLTAIEQAMRILERDFKRNGSKLDLVEWAKQMPAPLGLALRFSIVGPDGRLAQSDTERNPPRVDFSGRDEFRVQRNGNAGALYIGKPFLDPATERWTIDLSRRVERPDGSLAAVLIVSIDPNYFIRLYEPADLGDVGVIAVVGLDGFMRAHAGKQGEGRPAAISSSVSGTNLFGEMLAHSSGSKIVKSMLDGIERLHAYCRVQGYPLVVTVGYGLDEVLSAPQQAARQIILVGALATITLACLTIFLVAEVSRRSRREEELATERAKLEAMNRELIVSRNAAQAASRAKSEFLANISHELRTPLNAVIGFSELLKSEYLGPLGDQTYGEYARHILDGGKLLLEAINQILELSRSESGQLELREDAIDVAALVAATVCAFDEAARRGNVSMSLSLEGAPRSVRADGEKLRQVLGSLVSNAVKFTPAGGRVEVDARMAEDGDFAITVADTGIGMTLPEIKLAMEPFGQVDSRLTRKFSGLGLGLPLVQRLVALHDGTVRIQSEPGRGTTVTVLLPSARVISEDRAEAQPGVARLARQ